MPYKTMEDAARLLAQSRSNVAFTGAGISVASGIPAFRGESGIWDQYDPNILNINYYDLFPEKAWPLIKLLFYDFFRDKTPNTAHKILAEWELSKKLDAVITQNIDHLHQLAGNKNVIDFHGNAHFFVCRKCGWKGERPNDLLGVNLPECPSCKAILKPDFVFFGENIPTEAYQFSIEAVAHCDILLIIGTSGEVSPANQIPSLAKQNGAKIIEINTKETLYTHHVTDLFIKGEAADSLTKLNNLLKLLN